MKNKYMVPVGFEEFSWSTTITVMADNPRDATEIALRLSSERGHLRWIGTPILRPLTPRQERHQQVVMALQDMLNAWDLPLEPGGVEQRRLAVSRARHILLDENREVHPWP